MFKKHFWKYLLTSLAWAISLAGLALLLGFIEIKKGEVVCKAVKVFIPGTQYFIDKAEVDHILLTDGRTLVGSRLKNINIHELETRLKANPFIEHAQVYGDMDGTINVDINQRQPILRILNRFGQDFYVDQHGLKIPLSENFTSRVVAANGYIDEVFSKRADTLHTELAKDLFKTANYIRNNPFWDAQVAQLFVNQANEIELVPRVGNNKVLLGNADSLTSKFGNLLIFYKKVLPRVGWDAYKLINVKYASQVIGVRRDSTKTDSPTVKKIAPPAAKLEKGKPLIKK